MYTEKNKNKNKNKTKKQISDFLHAVQVCWLKKKESITC